MRSRLEPLKKVARSLREHRELLLNWFRAKGTLSGRYGRRIQQQSEIDHEKIVRLSRLRNDRTGIISSTWKLASAGIDPLSFPPVTSQYLARTSVVPFEEHLWLMPPPSFSVIGSGCRLTTPFYTAIIP